MKEKLLQVVFSSLKDAKKQFANGQIGKIAFKKYENLIITQSKNYDNHLGTNNTFKKLKDRFILETVILHTVAVAGIVSGNLLKKNCPVYKSNSLYSWYKSNNNNDTNTLLDAIREAINPEIEIIDSCHQILSELAGRHIGEFYTPATLVEHLITNSGFKSETMLNGANVVDPACGGGVILIKVAQKFLAYCHNHKISRNVAVSVLQNQLYGFDIQPFAILLTKTILAWMAGKYFLESDLDFNNIILIDPLIKPKRFWLKPKFDYVISNPPFMVIKRNSNEFLENYAKIIYGHPNLYSLFIWWSIKSIRSLGSVSLLIPQSMLAGAYYENLRKSIVSETKLIAVTKLLERKGIIQNADQQMMVVVLRKNEQKAVKNVAVKIVKKSSDIEKDKPAKIRYEKIIRDNSFSNIWVVSDKTLDYDIEEITRNHSETLGLVSGFKLGNGGYVWNQNKENLLVKQEPGSIPLISSASISRFLFTFPHNGNHPSKNRSFSKLTPKLERDLKRGNLLLVQRTTPRKVGRRLIGCVVDENFTQKHKSFFLENHVNYINTHDHNNFSLLGLLGWLNSDLINFIFQMRNGSTQVSIFELSLLPVNIALTKELTEPAKVATSNLGNDKEVAIQEINNVVYKKLGITRKQQKRIEQVLNWKE